MKLVSAKFKCLKGIYSKSGIKEISIDFTKCRHNIIYIVGKNGSGKSTLMSVLNPMPDSPSMYIDGEMGSKELVYWDNGVYYIISIVYPVVIKTGARAQTKASLIRSVNGTTEELNPNGTLGSYKDALCDAMNIDPTFVALSHISTEDRGIVDKKPADRKKFVAALLDSIEVYNSMYKTLTKKSTVLSSLMTSVSSKIHGIGDAQQLIMQRSAIEHRYSQLLAEKEEITEKISASETTIKLIDPDSQIQDRYRKLVQQKNDIESKLSILSKSGNGIDGASTEKQAVDLYVTTRDNITKLNAKLDSISSKISELLIDRDEDAKRIVIKTQKIKSMINKDDNMIDETIAEYEKKISAYTVFFNKLGITGDMMTKDEYIAALHTLEDIKSSIDSIRSFSGYEPIKTACEYILTSRNPAAELANISSNLSSLESDISSVKSSISYYTGLLDKITVLNNRPDTCNIDSCSFISDALSALSEEPDKQIKNANSKLKTLLEQREEYSNTIAYLEDVNTIYTSIQGILRIIKNNISTLSKICKGVFDNQEVFINKIANGDTFDFIYDIYSDIDKADMFELYKADMDILNTLKTRRAVLENQRTMIDDVQIEINELTDKLRDVDVKTEQLQRQKGEIELQISTMTSSLDKLNLVITKFGKISELKNSLNDVISQLGIISVNIKKISDEIKNLNQYKSKRNSIVSELEPLREQKEKLTYASIQLQEYKTEYDEYANKRILVDTLKRYASPTTGIQTVFMRIYMENTLNSANQLLHMLFGGELEILPYVINETEFRIPTRNLSTNLYTDDISNCSTSEKCMIAMILSFVLAFQGSETYNIVRLDEIDGGLDQYNRSIFPQILMNIMNTLNIDQCLIVSHSSESDMSNVDIISLTPVSSESIKGNVIFQL